MMRRTATLTATAVAAACYAALHWLARTCGATRAERRRPLPGDELCPAPQMVTTHAITIDASPEAVWPWLVQTGWGRGQWYTARWVDRLLFPANGPSAEVLVPGWQQLTAGDRILDGPPEAQCAFVVDDLDPPATWCCTLANICRPAGPSGSAPTSTGAGSSCSTAPR